MGGLHPVIPSVDEASLLQLKGNGTSWPCMQSSFPCNSHNTAARCFKGTLFCVHADLTRWLGIACAFTHVASNLEHKAFRRSKRACVHSRMTAFV